MVSPVLPEARVQGVSGTLKWSMGQEMGTVSSEPLQGLGSCLISLEFRRVGGSKVPIPQVTLHLSPISVSPWCLFFFSSARLSHMNAVSHVSLSPCLFCPSISLP